MRQRSDQNWVEWAHPVARLPRFPFSPAFCSASSPPLPSLLGANLIRAEEISFDFAFMGDLLNAQSRNVRRSSSPKGFLPSPGFGFRQDPLPLRVALPCYDVMSDRKMLILTSSKGPCQDFEYSLWVHVKPRPKKSA